MEETLEQIGLTSEETDIYLSLLNTGTQSAAQLAKNTKVKRTYVYRIVQNLINKGLATQGKQGRTTVFSPNSPDHLLTLAGKKKQQAELAEKQVEGFISGLKKMYATIEERPVVTVYEGFSGLKKIYMDTIKEGKPIEAFLQNTDINPEFRQWLRDYYVKERIKNNIFAKVIISSGEQAKEYKATSVDKLRESIIVPAKDFPFEVEVDIYGNKVAFMNFKDKDNPIGIIVENEAVSSTLSAFFDLCWKSLQKTTK